MFQILKRNPTAGVFAVLMHIAIIAFLIVGVDWLEKPKQPKSNVEVVQARVLDASRVAAEVEKLKQADIKRKEERASVRRQEEERLAELKRQQQAEQERIASLEQKRVAAEEKRKAEEQKRAVAEQQRKAEEQWLREAEVKRKAEEQKRLAAEKKRKAEEQKKREAEAKRKEVYGTTGPRMMVRFFGGWEFDDNDLRSRAPAFAGYEKGVPMGGTLYPVADSKNPAFLVAALKDPLSGNLDRIQIVKVWQQIGHSYEQVYDVVWSDDRKVGADGKVPAVGNTVDIKTATYDNSIGDSQLSAVWTDPDFDPTQHAAYYVRVLEIPTPRWSTYDAVALGIDPPSSVPATLQERAWSSSIWYTPSDEIMEMAKR